MGRYIESDNGDIGMIHGQASESEGRRGGEGWGATVPVVGPVYSGAGVGKPVAYSGEGGHFGCNNGSIT